MAVARWILDAKTLAHFDDFLNETRPDFLKLIHGHEVTDEYLKRKLLSLSSVPQLELLVPPPETSSE